MSTFDEAQWLAHEEAMAAAFPTYLIGLSGPPRSGKDSIGYALAKIIADRHPVHVCVRACSLPMRKAVYAMIGMDYSLEHYETTKDVTLPELGGSTIRQAMIALSEEHVKPRYGHGFWGSAVLNSLPMEHQRVVIVTDMGFDAEVKVFEEAFGPEHCLWPQIVRPGCDFSNDSRGYVGNLDYRTTIINEGESLDQVQTAAQRIYGRMLNQFHWELPTRS